MRDADRVRDALDLREIVSEYVALKPAGRNVFKGLCPFHKEKTPSFTVNVDRGLFYCFGCKRGGDVFSFVMGLEGWDFGEALRRLARRAGVELQELPGEKRKRDLYEVNELAQAWFRSNLAGEPLDYLRARGLAAATIEAWGLGWGPDSWDGLVKHARTRGASERELLDAGLVVANDRGGVYDRFRGRITFPISDHLGRLVGFSGRVLVEADPPAGPKYLNTPETALFDKGRLLFGLDRARPTIRESGRAIVVEGYTDVILLHQDGVKEAVATMGTALTPDHADLLARLGVRELVLAFDNDEAGQRATLGGLDHAVGRAFLVRSVRVPGGKDPADLVAAGKTADFVAALDGGVTEVEFRLQAALQGVNPASAAGRRQVLEALLPRLRKQGLIDAVADELRRRVVQALGLDEAQLLALIERPGGSRRITETQVQGLARRRQGVEATERELLRLVLHSFEVLRQVPPNLVLADPLVREALTTAREVTGPAALLDRFRDRPEVGALLAEIFEGPDPGEEVDEILNALLATLLRRQAETRSRDLAEQHRLLAQGQLTPDEERDVLRRIHELQVEAQRHKGGAR
jgi:DNA primase